MDFSEIMKEETIWTKTENGADCRNTTGSAMLDMFASIGFMRNRSDDEVIQKFELAYEEDPLNAVRCMFYARDIRGGLGERKVFRTMLKYVAGEHSEDLRKNLILIAEYGRWDDYYSMIGTELEDDMWCFLKEVLKSDELSMFNGEQCSLLAKWLKKADSKNAKTKKLGIYTAQKLGMSVYDFKRLCNKLRKYIDVVEVKMSNKQWKKINYPAVPSRAMMNYRNAFNKHDGDRFKDYLQSVNNGAEKINASTLYPYDIVEKILYSNIKDGKDVLNAQWNALPDYVDNDVNAVVIADTSGSMYGRPLASSIGLAIYFAERNKGAYHDLFMTFSEIPEFVQIKGKDIVEKVKFAEKSNWGFSTNLEAALELILDLAVKHNCTQKEIPKSLIIVSDMQINQCEAHYDRKDFYTYMEEKYKENGYAIPNIVFWNVRSPRDTFLADKDRKGVQLVSGQSASTFKNLIGCIGKTPMEMMYAVLNGDRYSKIII